MCLPPDQLLQIDADEIDENNTNRITQTTVLLQHAPQRGCCYEVNNSLLQKSSGANLFNLAFDQT